MSDHDILSSLFLIFSGAMAFSTVAMLTRQSLLIGYILLGMVIGPWGLQWESDAYLITQVGDIGIIFLLFLLGLHLDPHSLIRTLKRLTGVAFLSSCCFFAVGWIFAYTVGFSSAECWIIAASSMFSSTILGLKLMPSYMLHHHPIGECVIGTLLLQDVIAIVVLLILHLSQSEQFMVADLLLAVISIPLCILIAWLAERWVISPLFQRFSKMREYLFVLSIGWCLALAECGASLGLSHEVGAFIAGVSIASSPFATYLAESLTPLRDFFLVLFFFSVGASFNLSYLGEVILPALAFALILCIVKPFIFKGLLTYFGESDKHASEVAFRLGHMSEFSILISALAVSSPAIISSKAAYFIQASTLITFFILSYIISSHYPTPMSSTSMAMDESVDDDDGAGALESILEE